MSKDFFSSDYPQENSLYLPPNALARFGKSRVTAPKLSPDRTLIAVASRIGVWLYNAHTYDFLSLIAVEGTGILSKIAFSPDSSQIVTGDWDGLTKLWDIDSGAELATFAHKDYVISIAFSNDGKYLATGSRDRSATLWDVATEEALFTINHEDSVTNVLFSSDGRQVATGSWDGTATLWDIATGKHLETFSHPSQEESVTFSSGNVANFNDGGIQYIAFSPDGLHFATSGRLMDKSTRLWEVGTGKQLWTITHEASVETLVFSPTGEYIATGARDGQVHLWEIATGKPGLTVTHDKSVEAIAFSEDSSLFATGSADGIVNVWQVKSAENVTSLTGLGRVNALQYLSNRTLLVGTDSAVEIWSVDKQLLGILPHSQDDWGWHHVSFSPDGQLLAGMNQHGTIALWDVHTGGTHKTLKNVTGYKMELVFSSEGRCVGISKVEDTLKLWDGFQTILFIPEEEVMSATVSSDSSLVAAGGREGTVKLWCVETQECCQTLSGHIGQINSLAFSPDGTFLVSGGGDNWEIKEGDDGIVHFFLSGDSPVDTTANVWEVSTGQNIATLKHPQQVCVVTFSPDGKTVATSTDKTVILWCTKTWQTLATLDTVRVESLSFSHDGAYLAIGGTWPEQCIQIWNVETARRITEFSGHKSDVESVAFSPDNQLLASGGFDGVIYLWNITPYLKNG